MWYTLTMENTKICTLCNLPKPLDTSFNKQSKSKDGYQSYCKECAQAKIKQWRLDNIEHRKQYEKEYNQANPDKVLKWARDWRKNNPERVKELRKQFADNNPELMLLYEAKKRAKKRGTPFSISVEDVVIPEFCPVFGMKLERGIGQLTDASPTIDALIPSLGYVKGNINVISHKANRIKSDATLNELLLILKWKEEHKSPPPSEEV